MLEPTLFSGTSPIKGIKVTSKVSAFTLFMNYKNKLLSAPLWVSPPKKAKYVVFEDVK